MDLFKNTVLEEDLLLEGFGRLVDFDPSLQDGSSSSLEEILNSSSCSSPLDNDQLQPAKFLDGSTCSSPQEDDSEAFGFHEFEDVFFPAAAEMIGSQSDCNDMTASAFGLDNRIQTKVDPFALSRGDLSVENIESLKHLLLCQTGDILRSSRKQQILAQKPANSFSEQFSYRLAPFNGVVTDDSVTPYNNSNDIFFRAMNHSQQHHQQQEQKIEQQQQQFTSIVETEVKRESSESSDADVEGSPMAASPTQQKIKRKKRKYERRASARKSIQLYQFMLKLLDSEDECVTWVSREDGIFKLLKSKNVAQMWGKYKKNDNMTYESLSRALRHYYAQDILLPVPKKLHYKFCQKTLDNWYNAKNLC